MPAFSAVGRARLFAYGATLLCNLLVFALAAHVGTFSGFFYVADQAPLVLSIFTFVVVGGAIVADCRGGVRPAVEFTWLGLLSVFWLAFNAFSSSRWRYVQAADCASLPAEQEFARIAGWCKGVQALRAFVWIEWALILCTFLLLLRYVTSQANAGHSHVWRSPLARYVPRAPPVLVSRPVDAFAKEGGEAGDGYFFGGEAGSGNENARTFGGAYHGEQPAFTQFNEKSAYPQYGGQQQQQSYGVALPSQQFAATSRGQGYDQYAGHYGSGYAQ